MKYFFSILFLALVGSVIYLYYAEMSFNPLKEKEFSKLFNEYSKKPKKICSKYFLGFSARGEYFEIYRYEIEPKQLYDLYPKIGIWENKKITNNVIVPKWKKIPLDSTAKERFEFILTMDDFDKYECSSSFNKEIHNPNNYFSYVYFHEMKYYFLLYCPDKKELFYIRKKGF